MPTAPPVSNLDEAREILFGDRHRVLENRLAEVESVAATKSAEAEAKADALEKALSERLEQMTAELTGRIEDLEKKLRMCQRRLRALESVNSEEGKDD